MHENRTSGEADPPKAYDLGAGGIDVTPTLPVSDMDDAVRFCEAAGFDVEPYDDGFAFVHLQDRSVFDLDLVAGMNPSTNHAGCNILTADVNDWHDRLAAAGLPVTPVEDMPWGMHEFTFTGPSGSNTFASVATRPTTESGGDDRDHRDRRICRTPTRMLVL
jgi:acetyl esterase/lipase